LCDVESRPRSDITTARLLRHHLLFKRLSCSLKQPGRIFGRVRASGSCRFASLDWILYQMRHAAHSDSTHSGSGKRNAGGHLGHGRRGPLCRDVPDKFCGSVALTSVIVVADATLRATPRLVRGQMDSAVFGTSVFLYSGVVFSAAHARIVGTQTGMIDTHQPGDSVSFGASLAATFGLSEWSLVEVATLITIMILLTAGNAAASHKRTGHSTLLPSASRHR